MVHTLVVLLLRSTAKFEVDVAVTAPIPFTAMLPGAETKLMAWGVLVELPQAVPVHVTEPEQVTLILPVGSNATD
jgi:hypothetical protein